MKKVTLLFSLFLCALAAPLWGGTESQSATPVPTTTGSQTEAVPLDVFNTESAYVFESDVNHGGSFGKQEELENEIEYAHRFLLTGNFYLHTGISYDRFDFGTTKAPVPDHLQSTAAVIGVDYMHGSDVGAFFQVRPGFYTQNDFDSSSFDVPITLGSIFVLQPDKLYVFAGAYAAFLRGGYPVLPLAGVIWIPNDQVRLMAVLPEPKLIYSATKNIDLYVGGEVTGGSFRTDADSAIVPHKLDNTQVDFTDYRAGVGLSYAICHSFTADFGAGYSIERQFAFHRAGENYRTDPSPYLRLELKAQF